MSKFRVMPMWEIELEAIGKCCQVIVAKDDELQLDLDSEESYFYCKSWLTGDFFTRFWPSSSFFWNEWKSRNGNWHITVPLPGTLSIPERIALQLIGGSDSRREFAALCCYWDGAPHPILLFKPCPKLLGNGEV